jgi:hypothetical protein
VASHPLILPPRSGTQWRSIFGDPMHETRDGQGRARHTARDVVTVELGEA